MRPDSIQIQADATATLIISPSDPSMHTLTLKKLTPNGADGTVTLKNGKVTGFTKPT